MSLIDETKKLRELEQKYKITPYDGNLEVYSLHLREHGSAMLEVLGMIREGDAAICQLMIEILSQVGKDSIITIRLKPGRDISEYIDCMNRHQKMAELMEQEVQP